MRSFAPDRRPVAPGAHCRPGRGNGGHGQPVKQLAHIDVLFDVQHYTNWTRHFGPLSGSDPKLENALERYIITAFSYGCNLGPAQTARHMRGMVTTHQISFVNRRHVTAAKLDEAIRDVINPYNRLGLPKVWGDGSTVAADGTKFDLYEENLISEYHIRYGGYGGIAYQHVSDTYIALFSHFIPCGVWEAVYIIDGLLKNKSDIQPDTVHADTQNQANASHPKLERPQVLPSQQGCDLQAH